MHPIGTFKLAERGKQRGALVASDSTKGRTSSNAQMGPRVWVLGNVPQDDVQVETDFPSGFLCDTYVPDDPRSSFAGGTYAPQSLGDNWGVTHGQDGDGTDILSQQWPWVLPGSPQLRNMEWNDWSYDLGRFDRWTTGLDGQGTLKILDSEWSIQHDSQIHPVYGDLTPPGDNPYERRTGMATGTLLEDKLSSPTSTGPSLEENNPLGLGGWGAWDQYGK